MYTYILFLICLLSCNRDIYFRSLERALVNLKMRLQFPGFLQAPTIRCEIMCVNVSGVVTCLFPHRA